MTWWRGMAVKSLLLCCLKHRLKMLVTIAERLRLSVSQADPGKLDGKQLPKVTISLGVASRQQKYTLDMLITAADAAFV